MSKDILYLIKAPFIDGDNGPYYCPGCAEMLGLLAIYPELQNVLEVRYVEFARPRPELVQRLGEENQSCPVLVLGDTDISKLSGDLKVQKAGTEFFVEGPREIGEYLAACHGIGIPH